MTILSSGSTYSLTIPAGNALVTLDLSGTSTVTGVTREDASYWHGTGAKACNPVSTATAITISTTGQVDYRFVAGDATPSSERFLYNPVTYDSSTAGAAAVAAAVTSSKRLTAQTLIAGYEAERRIVDQYGSALLRRVGRLAAGDTPALTASNTTPSADADMTGRTIKTINLSGVSRGLVDVTTTDANEIASLKRWIKGFNPALRVRWGAPNWRLSNSIGNRSGSGNQDSDTGSILNSGYGINNNGLFMDIDFYGDILFMTGANALPVYIWVNGNLITTGDVAAGTGLTASKPDGAGNNMCYTFSGSGLMFLKIKFPSVGRRHIRIGHYGAGGLGDLYFGAQHTAAPLNQSSLNGIFFSDSFGTGTGGYSGLHGFGNFLTADFGQSGINFVNASEGSTGYVADSSATKFSFLARQSIDFPRNYTPDFTVTWASMNDRGVAGASSAISQHCAFLTQTWPNGLHAIFGTDPGTTSINAGAGSKDVDIEATIAAAVSPYVAAGQVLYIPVQLDSAGPWMYGTGHVGATTGDGNCDLFVSSADTTHPSGEGHKYLGQRGASALYNSLRRLALGS